MSAAWLMRRPVRAFLAGMALSSGFLIAKLLLHQSSFALISSVYVTGLAALIGTGKRASP